MKRHIHSYNDVLASDTYLQIGRYITSRGGVVAADELAPYLDVPSSKSDAVCFAYCFLYGELMKLIFYAASCPSAGPLYLFTSRASCIAQ